MDDREKRRVLPQDSGHSQADEPICSASAQAENGDDEMDALFWNANFAAEDEGFRMKLWARLKRRMEEMEEEEERELQDEEISGLAAGGKGSSLPYMNALKRMIGR